MIDVEVIESSSLGDRSYLASDGEVAVVIDPQRDVDRVLAVAGRLGVRGPGGPAPTRAGRPRRAGDPAASRLRCSGRCWWWASRPRVAWWRGCAPG